MWNTAVMAMISLSAIGFAVADGETRRVRWIQAMRRCILRMNDVIHYERLPLAALLARMDLRATREQRELTRLLHLCGERMENSANPQLVELFVREAGRTPSYGVLAEADREAFEQVLGELGRRGGVSDADLGGCAMNIDLLFQIAGVGILIFAVNQVQQKAGREDIAVLASVAGLVVVMFLVVDLVAQLLNNVKSIFGLY